MKPYYAVDKTIYFTDRVEEILIYIFDQEDTETICVLLNNAYNAAYQDGLNASLSNHHKDLLDKLFLLTMENSRLNSLLKMKE